MKPHIYTCKGYWYCSDGALRERLLRALYDSGEHGAAPTARVAAGVELEHLAQKYDVYRRYAPPQI